MAGMPPDDGKARAAIVAAAGLGMVYALPALAKPVPALRTLLRIDAHTASGEGVALTFDDGPHPDGTPAVLETLREHRVRATFFLVGEQVARSPALAAEVAAAGHGVGLHCDRHRNMLRLTPRQVSEDMDRASDRIVSATGVVPALHRPPYGVYSAAGLWQVRRRGLRALLWTHWGHDWSVRATPESIADEVTGGVRAGSVLLLHDGDAYSSAGSWRRTAAAVPAVLERIDAAGLSCVAP
jgi:peptidoglycan/xylan/chitin deacetylase (PgdA/CDA1 family)